MSFALLCKEKLRIRSFRTDKKETWRGVLRSNFGRISFTMGKMVSFLIILGIRIYQSTLSGLFPPSCRFYPSCSQYAIQALKKFGPVKGGWLSVKRLSRCHPFNPGGFDPLP